MYTLMYTMDFAWSGGVFAGAWMQQMHPSGLGQGQCVGGQLGGDREYLLYLLLNFAVNVKLL